MIRSCSCSSPVSLVMAFSLQHHVGHKPLPTPIILWFAAQSAGQNSGISSPGFAGVNPRQSWLDQHRPCAPRFTSLQLCKSQVLSLKDSRISLQAARKCLPRYNPPGVRQTDRLPRLSPKCSDFSTGHLKSHHCQAARCHQGSSPG